MTESIKPIPMPKPLPGERVIDAGRPAPDRGLKVVRATDRCATSQPFVQRGGARKESELNPLPLKVPDTTEAVTQPSRRERHHVPRRFLGETSYRVEDLA